MKKYPEIFTGVCITALFLVLSFFQGGFPCRLEFGFYDLAMNLSAEKRTHEKIVIVEIDKRSLAGTGRWPWSFSTLAKGIRKIDAAAPKVIGLGVMMDHAEDNSGARQIRFLLELFSETVPTPNDDRWREFGNALKEAQRNLDGGRVLSEAIKNANKVILPARLGEPAVPSRRGAPLLPPAGHMVNGVTLDTGPPAKGIALPVPSLLAGALGTGHVNLEYDPDGKVRQERLLYPYRDRHIPSYALRLAAAFKGVPAGRITARQKNNIQIGTLGVAVDGSGRLGIGFRRSPEGFLRCSWLDVVNNKVPASLFRNRLVLITPAAPGIVDFTPTPVNSAMTPGELTAHTVASILDGAHVERPAWEPWARVCLILIAGAIPTLLLPRLRPLLSLALVATLLLVFAGASAVSFLFTGIWLRMMLPSLLLAAGSAGLMGIRYLGRVRHPAGREERIRMSGVMLHKRGKLDKAFEEFRKIPVDDEMKGLLYGLGLDYEKKMEIHKALYVYQYLEEHDPAFKDLAQRKSRLLQSGETMVIGDDTISDAPGADPGPADTFDAAAPAATIDAAAGAPAPIDAAPNTLGRYEIIGELGRGAMGVVYQGRDPRINRVTAIKTIRFSDNYESREAEKAKTAFFREAESAGTLSHPHIVTIYDAGEEEGLAYIAMEYLEGEDLTGYIHKENLLPVRKVIDYIADIADALGFAHEKGIVHRDIKPANIMLLKGGTVKITDFGIAKITASSQTRTGVVKGTPFYMSPEQITGKKVDGRSDIFSLGVMLYQLLTGEIPFSDENPAALMHKILYDPHPDPRAKNPGIYKPLAAIIDKALEKEQGSRYQKAGQMAGHLRKLARLIDAAAKKRSLSKQEGR